MAVASFYVDGEAKHMRGFPPPKTSSLTHWYRAAVAGIREAPDWRTVDISNVDVSEETIVFFGDTWTLFVARKRDLR